VTTATSTLTKVCRGCGAEYPATPEYFYRNYSCKYGVATHCKWCAREKAAIRRGNPTGVKRKTDAPPQPPNQKPPSPEPEPKKDVPPDVFVPWWAQCVRTGEVLTDRRREVCRWLVGAKLAKAERRRE